MAAIVAYELGVDIFCDESGMFSATVNGRLVQEKSITKIKKAIKSAAPTVALIKKDRVYREVGGLSTVHIARVETSSAGVTGLEVISDRWSCHHVDLYEYDQSVIDAEGQLTALYAEKIRELNQWRTDMFGQITHPLVPITEERFAELREAAQKTQEG